jgi:predicted AAA+ superfamily ATPase
VGTNRQNHQVNWVDETSSETRSACLLCMSFAEHDQAYRAISTGKLHASPHFHTRPINVVVYHGSQRSLVLRWVSRLDAFSGYPVHT